jgi:hypothetical protein
MQEWAGRFKLKERPQLGGMFLSKEVVMCVDALTLFQIRLSGPKGNFGPPSDFSPLPPSQLPDPTKANSQIDPFPNSRPLILGR